MAYKDDIVNARRTAKGNLALMKDNLSAFNRVKNGANYRDKVKNLLAQKEEFTDKQCSYINEVIYEIFMQGFVNAGCPSTYRYTKPKNKFY